MSWEVYCQSSKYFWIRCFVVQVVQATPEHLEYPEIADDISV